MPQTLKAKLVKKTNLAREYWLYDLEFPERFDFSAGQFVSVKVTPEGIRRSYSIASAPGVNQIQLLINVKPMGPGSKFFLECSEGIEMELMGPMGRFMVATARVKPDKMFIATGSGMAPIWSMIVDLLKNKNYAEGRLKLIWGMRYEEDLFWLKELGELKDAHSNFDYEIVLSKPGEHWHGSCGHIGDCLREGFILREANLTSWEFYLCGGQEMIRETVEYLTKGGVTEVDIHFEKFF